MGRPALPTIGSTIPYAGILSCVRTQVEASKQTRMHSLPSGFDCACEVIRCLKFLP